MISRVTLPGCLSDTSRGSLRITVASVSPCSPWTTTLSRNRNHRLRELRKNSRRVPRRETWMISDMVGPLWRTCRPLHAAGVRAAGKSTCDELIRAARVSNDTGVAGYLERPSPGGGLVRGSLAYRPRRPGLQRAVAAVNSSGLPWVEAVGAAAGY